LLADDSLMGPLVRRGSLLMPQVCVCVCVIRGGNRRSRWIYVCMCVYGCLTSFYVCFNFLYLRVLVCERVFLCICMYVCVCM
jgi:hypothetical protein